MPRLGRNVMPQAGGIVSSAGTMDKTIALLNVEYLRKRLTEVTDDVTRKTGLQLLADEEAKLEMLTKPPRGGRRHA